MTSEKGSVKMRLYYIFADTTIYRVLLMSFMKSKRVSMSRNDRVNAHVVLCAIINANI